MAQTRIHLEPGDHVVTCTRDRWNGLTGRVVAVRPLTLKRLVCVDVNDSAGGEPDVCEFAVDEVLPAAQDGAR